MSRRTVLLIATTTGYQIRSFSDAASALGIRLVFASDRCDHLDDPWRDDAIPVRFHELDSSTRQIVHRFHDTKPDGIVAVGDRPTLLAAHAAAAFGLPGNSPAAAQRSRNKLASRQALRSAGLPTPTFRQVALVADPATVVAGWAFPVVLKPLALSGSRGVMRADDEEELGLAFERLRRLLKSPDILQERDEAHDAVLIESFIPGAEYAVEGVLTNGEFTLFAIFDKPDPLDGPFFEETIYVTPSRTALSTQEAIRDAVRLAAQTLGLRHGPVHAECRVNDRGVYVLEVAPRPIGGLCSRALRFTRRGDTLSLEEVLLLHAVGESIGDIAREDQSSGVMMIPTPGRGVFRATHGVDDARGVALIEDVQMTAKADAVLTPLPEGRSYLGFIFARGGARDAVEEALREAYRRLRFVIDRELPMVSDDPD